MASSTNGVRQSLTYLVASRFPTQSVRDVQRLHKRDYGLPSVVKWKEVLRSFRLDMTFVFEGGFFTDFIVEIGLPHFDVTN